MIKILVTGATGILGSNVCTMLIEKGYKARAIARNMNAADVDSLKRAGVEVVAGDVTDLDSIERAADGVDAVVHSAAMLGWPGSTWEGSWAANVIGSIHVLTAAARKRGVPVVQVLTTTFFQYGNKPLTEQSPIDFNFDNKDMYSTTKRLAYAEGVARVADGQDIRFVIPGAIYGSSVCIQKAMDPAGHNANIARAIRGEMPPCLPFPFCWVTAHDCAFVCIAALEKGERGERYIAHGVTAEGDTIASVLNRVSAMAGSPHRMEEVPREQLDSPEIAAKFGPTMPTMAKKNYVRPIADSRFTEKKLGYVPTPQERGFTETIAWMRGIGAL
jgi:nucleoside-diphosphate-sugar epimerase